MAVAVTNPIVHYFGYGAHVSGDIMEAILGRRPSSRQAVLSGYELRKHSWSDIPSSIQEVLGRNGWGPEYRVYAIRPNEGSVVHGMLWDITREELQLLDHRQMMGMWFKSTQVAVEAEDSVFDGVETEMIDDPAGIVVDGRGYNPFLNPKEQTLESARAGTEAFLRERAKPPVKEREI